MLRIHAGGFAGGNGAAVVLLAWHNIWMSMHGAQLATGAKQVGLDVKQGRRELSAVLVLIALAVLLFRPQGLFGEKIIERI